MGAGDKFTLNEPDETVQIDNDFNMNQLKGEKNLKNLENFLYNSEFMKKYDAQYSGTIVPVFFIVTFGITGNRLITQCPVIIVNKATINIGYKDKVKISLKNLLNCFKDPDLKKRETLIHEMVEDKFNEDIQKILIKHDNKIRESSGIPPSMDYTLSANTLPVGNSPLSVNKPTSVNSNLIVKGRK